MIAKVLVPYNFDRAFDYIIPEGMELEIGDVVKVPLGSKTVFGVIWEFGKTELDINKIKEIKEKTAEKPIPNELILFLSWVSKYSLISLGNTLNMTLGTLASFKEVKKPRKNEEIIFINPPYNINTLNDKQEEAFNFLYKKLDSGYSATLLEGITGSGKTEVYFHLIAKILEKEEGQILLLLPEISLTAQLLERFKSQFGFYPAVWHSQITTAKKRNLWKNIREGNSRVIIGARSALFLPYNKLSLIIVDEEHDSSFKQTENGVYNARDMAIVRANINQIPIILSSATPSLETLINVENGKYDRVYLPSRYGEAILPDIEIVDLKKEKLRKDKYISKFLKEEILKTIKNGKQVLLFLNRRGYAPLVLCRECGYKITCPHCSCALTKHKSQGKLICHHCGYTTIQPAICPSCEKENTFIDFGPGVEKIQDEIKEYFPELSTEIITSDTIQSPSKFKEIIDKISNNQVNIVIGTQLVAKGHNFPSLTLVGIIDADASLFGGDLRSAEKTYQLLTQVSGRAGRVKDKGKVIIQSYSADNIILKSIKEGNSRILIDFEKQNRKLGNFPPYGKLALILFSGKNEANVLDSAKLIARNFPYSEDIEILGPTPSGILKVSGEYRYKILIKTSKRINIQKLIDITFKATKLNSNIKVKIDIDPISI